MRAPFTTRPISVLPAWAPATMTLLSEKSTLEVATDAARKTTRKLLRTMRWVFTGTNLQWSRT